MAKNFKCLSADKQRSAVMSFLCAQFNTPYWNGTCNPTGTTRFDEDLGVSNLDMAMLINDAKEEFGVSLFDEDVNEIRTLNDFVEKIIH